MRTGSNIIALIVGLLLLANGVWMVMTPLGWFTATPIVWRTGVANAHFIRDVGWTYATVGALVIGGLVHGAARTLLLSLAAIWLGGHAIIHIGELAVGICSARQFTSEIPQVVGPLVLLLFALGLGAFSKKANAG